jgi:hypothetical protein
MLDTLASDHTFRIGDNAEELRRRAGREAAGYIRQTHVAKGQNKVLESQ